MVPGGLLAIPYLLTVDTHENKLKFIEGKIQ